MITDEGIIHVVNRNRDEIVTIKISKKHLNVKKLSSMVFLFKIV